MAEYETEHNIQAGRGDDAEHSDNAPRHGRRGGRARRLPDMASFYSALSAVDTSTTNNPHAVPTPGEVSAVYRILAEAVNIIRRDVSGDPTRSNDVGDGGADPGTASAPWNSNSMDRVWESLLQEVENPPRIVKGCSQDFLDALDRVPKKTLKPTDTCPICNTAFLDDKYPLVVRLPCHDTHVFDLECISPWLKVHTTCPLDRTDLLVKKDRGDDRRDPRQPSTRSGANRRQSPAAANNRASASAEDPRKDAESDEERDEIDSMYL
ncbi:MAG: hypothetical protein M1815_006137 [Lichina confinis]|nr:MAG: hypothetical protein M1815_006137 [Lichina confinis]